jgi:GT2 family glycosyltransferase
MKINPKVSIIILNWNGWEDTIECLESLYKINYSNYEVFVVDNNSQNDSIKKIRDWTEGRIKVKSKFLKYNSNNKPIKYFICPESRLNSKNYRLKKIKFNKISSEKKLFIIKNKKNYGFSKGNNIAIKQVLDENESKYLLLLNNDTVVDKKFLSKLVEIAENDNRIAIVGPKIYYYDYKNKNNIIYFGGGKIDWEKYPGYHNINRYKEDSKNINNNPKRIDWISGTCMMLNIENINPLLNEKFYFGCEDIDKCLESSREKLKIIYVPKAIIWHKQARSRKKMRWRKLNSYISNIKLLRKHDKNWGLDLTKNIFKKIVTQVISLIRKKIKSINQTL